MEAVDVPICLESRNPVALENALQLGCGKPIISSVTGEAVHLDQLLPWLNIIRLCSSRIRLIRGPKFCSQKT